MEQEAFLQALQHIIEHPDPDRSSLLGVIGRAHLVRLEQLRRVPQPCCHCQQLRDSCLLTWEQGQQDSHQ